MSLLSMIAANSKRLVIETFFSDATWVCPVTTFRIERLIGSGCNGIPGTTINTYSGTIAQVNYLVNGTGGASGGQYTWTQVNDAIQVAVSRLSSTSYGQQTWDDILVNQNGVANNYTATLQGHSIPNVKGGTVTTSLPGDWLYSGGINNGGANRSWTATISVQYWTGPAQGGNATVAFGRTFPGGVGVPSTPQQYTNEPVVPGNSYSISVSTATAGGFVQIEYLR